MQKNKIESKEAKLIISISRKFNHKPTTHFDKKQLKNIIKTFSEDEKHIYTKYYFDFSSGKAQDFVLNAEENIKTIKKSLKYFFYSACLFTLLFLMSGCTTTRTEYIELEPVIKKEFVFLNCKVPSELLTTNEIKIEKEKAFEILQKIAKETNDRKRKIELIKSIECIEEI